MNQILYWLSSGNDKDTDKYKDKDKVFQRPKVCYMKSSPPKNISPKWAACVLLSRYCKAFDFGFVFHNNMKVSSGNHTGLSVKKIFTNKSMKKLGCYPAVNSDQLSVILSDKILQNTPDISKGGSVLWP